MIDKHFKTKESGITLIALVVTIIVLLILAGVSIAMLTGENGILNQATKAKNETEKAQANEALILDEYNKFLNNAIGGTTGGAWLILSLHHTKHSKKSYCVSNKVLGYPLTILIV